MSMVKARTKAWAARNVYGSWGAAARVLGMSKHNLYDIANRPATMSKKRKVDAMTKLGYPPQVKRYWRPCLSLSTQKSVEATLIENPGYTLEDIIDRGIVSLTEDFTEDD